MFDIGYMNFFSIDFCGLYKVGNSKTFGCEAEETFDLILDWAKPRPLNSTIPWDPDSAKRNRPKCYCQDIHKDERTGDFFLVLWKSDTDSAGTLWGAPEDDKTGTGSVVKYTSQYQGRKKVVWGRPCYYWVVPRLNLVVSVKFDHSVCDAQLFEDYIVACMNNRVKHPNRKKEYTDHGFVRISYIGSEDVRYQYRFKMSLKSLNTSSAELQNLVKNITHIVRRETILVDSKDERSEWVKKFTEYVPFVAAKPKSKTRKIEVKAEAKPTVSEIHEIIEKNAVEGRKPNDWDNVGFMTEKGVTWVDRYRLRNNITINGEKDAFITAEKLCEHIMKERDKLLAPVNREALEEKIMEEA